MQIHLMPQNLLANKSKSNSTCFVWACKIGLEVRVIELRLSYSMAGEEGKRKWISFIRAWIHKTSDVALAIYLY